MAGVAVHFLWWGKLPRQRRLATLFWKTVKDPSVLIQLGEGSLCIVRRRRKHQILLRCVTIFLSVFYQQLLLCTQADFFPDQILLNPISPDENWHAAKNPNSWTFLRVQFSATGRSCDLIASRKLAPLELNISEVPLPQSAGAPSLFS